MKESQIKIRCSAHLLNKHGSLMGAFNTSSYYIKVTESEFDGIGEPFLLKLCKEDSDNKNAFDSSNMDDLNFETAPISETSDSNAVTVIEKFEVANDGIINIPIPELKESSQQTTSDNQSTSNNYDDIVITEVSQANDLLISHGQKQSCVSSVLTVAGRNLSQFRDSQIVATCSSATDQKATARMLHSIYHTLHGLGPGNCPFHLSIQDCLDDYDEKFAYGFNQYLMGISSSGFIRGEFPLCSDSGHKFFEYTKLSWNYNERVYVQCIKDHFKANICPFDNQCTELWKFCISNKLYGALKYSREGLLIHSKHQSGKIGTICAEYLEYQETIGSGGCGEVYKFSLKCAKSVQLALKEERMRPMIENIKVFEQMIELNSKHVIKMLEYIIGPSNENGDRLFLFVMPHMNRGGLHVQLKHSCILNYFLQFPKEMNDIFRNYIMVCLHLLRGLQYLQKYGIVHRDVKVSNILVQQNCECVSPLRCKCDGDGGVQYVLGDLNLMCMEDDQSGKGGEWEKMLQHAPAGTIGKIAPELFFKTNQGERFGSHKSDVYSACLTMMEILASNKLQAISHEPIAEFFEAISASYQAPFTKIQHALKILDRALSKAQRIAEISKIKQLLYDGQRYIQQIQAFQGCYVDEIYLDKCPLARILANVYGANTLHWTCIQKFPNIYHSNLWPDMKIVLDVIKDGMQLLPQKRPDATELIRRLEIIHPPSKTLFEKLKSKNTDDVNGIL